MVFNPRVDSLVQSGNFPQILIINRDYQWLLCTPTPERHFSGVKVRDFVHVGRITIDLHVV